jgi:hypothetical protein
MWCCAAMMSSPWLAAGLCSNRVGSAIRGDGNVVSHRDDKLFVGRGNSCCFTTAAAWIVLSSPPRCGSACGCRACPARANAPAPDGRVADLAGALLVRATGSSTHVAMRHFSSTAAVAAISPVGSATRGDGIVVLHRNHNLFVGRGNSFCLTTAAASMVLSSPPGRVSMLLPCLPSTG